jgi:hypothetical protein
MSERIVFDYEQMVANSLIYVVKQALEITQKSGLPEKHYFNITFLTQYPGVKMPDHLIKQYPDEMTIVLQYEFSNLQVDDKGFSVLLSFSGVPTEIYIPFAAIRFFVDPGVSFGLQFNPVLPKKKNVAAINDVTKKVNRKSEVKKDAEIIDFKSLRKK